MMKMGKTFNDAILNKLLDFGNVASLSWLYKKF